MTIINKIFLFIIRFPSRRKDFFAFFNIFQSLSLRCRCQMAIYHQFLMQWIKRLFMGGIGFGCAHLLALLSSSSSSCLQMNGKQFLWRRLQSRFVGRGGGEEFFAFKKINRLWDALQCNMIGNITDQVAEDTRECSLGFCRPSTITFTVESKLYPHNRILKLFIKVQVDYFSSILGFQSNTIPGRAVDWLKLKLFFHSPTNTIKFAKLFASVRSPRSSARRVIWDSPRI